MKEILSDPRFGKECFKLSNLNDSITVTKEDLVEIFGSRKMHEEESFFVLDSRSNEITTRHGVSFRDDALLIREAFNEGNTILVKRLHELSAKFSKLAQEFDEHANTYMLVNPEGGESFGWHTDDRDICIKLVHGSKLFFYRDKLGEEVAVEMNQGDWLMIPEGVEHRAVNIGSCIVLTFGIVSEPNWYVEGCLGHSDLQREFPTLF